MANVTDVGRRGFHIKFIKCLEFIDGLRFRIQTRQVMGCVPPQHTASVCCGHIFGQEFTQLYLEVADFVLIIIVWLAEYTLCRAKFNRICPQNPIKIPHHAFIPSSLKSVPRLRLCLVWG